MEQIKHTFLGLDFSSSCCAWSVMRRVINSEQPDSCSLSIYGKGIFSFDAYDKKEHGRNEIGYKMHVVSENLREVLLKYEPDVIFFEEIFAQTTTGYKTLSKIQGMAERECFLYSMRIKCNPVLVYAYASEVRACYNLNVHKKKYMLQFDEKEICNRYYEAQVKALQERSKKPPSDARIMSIFTKVFSKPKIYLSKAYDEYKKQVVIDFVNSRFNLNLTYADNDLADSLLNCYFIAQCSPASDIQKFFDDEAKNKKKIKKSAKVDE